MDEWKNGDTDPHGPLDVDLEELGEDSEPVLLTCPACGEDVFEEAQQCPQCGEYIIPTDESDQPVDWQLLVGVMVVFALALLVMRIGC